MKDTDPIDIKIKIATQQLTLRVPFNTQDNVREAENHIASLYSTWHRQFPQKSEYELMAMLTYQYASFYLAMKERQDSAGIRLGNIADKLAATLRDDTQQHS